MKKVKREASFNSFEISLKYTFLLYVLFLAALLRSQIFYLVTLAIFAGFLFTGYKKNKSLVNSRDQIFSELKFLTGSVKKMATGISLPDVLRKLSGYKLETLICIVYVVTMLSVISWGLPNNNHPFPYYMDESHSLQAVKTVVRYGTSNLPKQEVGPMFNYIVSAVLVSPLFLFRIVNPAAISTAISALIVQAQIYMALRAITFLFGLFTLIVLVRISNFFKIRQSFYLAFFVFTPVWLSISNYFKYDIALLFWITLCFLLNLKYANKPNRQNFILTSICAGLAVSTKITGITLLPILVFSFFYFTPNYKKQFNTLIIGVVMYFATFIFCGIPDVIFAGRSISEYLYYNIFSNPQNDKTFIFGVSHFYYVFFQLLPAIFGHFFFAIVMVSIVYLITKVVRAVYIKKFTSIKLELFSLVVLAFFALSLSPLWIIAANRALVLLPWFVLIVGIFIKDLNNKLNPTFRKIVLIVLLAGVALQIFESFSWIWLKYSVPPQTASSKWIASNIPANTLIGIENIPVYELLPDIVIREFYEKQYGVKKNYRYNYEIVDFKSKKLPPVVVLSNAQLEYNLRKTSLKKSLVTRLYKEHYYEVAGFSPAPEYYKVFSNDINFTMSGMTAVPKRISVFMKKRK